MAIEPENLVLSLLRDIRAKQDELDLRLRHVESQLDDLHATVVYSLGVSTETKFKQSKQEARIDELVSQVEKLLGEEKPL